MNLIPRIYVRSVLRLQGRRGAVVRLALLTFGMFALVGLGVFLVWLGRHPDGSGRPPAWNVFAGSTGLAVFIPASVLLLLLTLQEAGAVPAVVAIGTRKAVRIGSPFNFLTFRPLRTKMNGAGMTMKFDPSPLVVPGRYGYAGYVFRLIAEDGSSRGYLARSPIEEDVRRQALAVLKELTADRGITP